MRYGIVDFHTFISVKRRNLHLLNLRGGHFYQNLRSSPKNEISPFGLFSFLASRVKENRCPLENRHSAAIFRAVVESNGRFAMHGMRANAPSFAKPDSPRLHQLRTVILIESYRSFLLQKSH